MKWHSFKFDNHQVDTFICKSIATGRKYLDIELDGEFIVTGKQIGRAHV